MWLSKTSKCLSFGFFSPILVLLCSYISSLRIWIVVWSSRTLERELSMAGVGTEEKWVGSANTVVRRFAPARRQCSQLKKKEREITELFICGPENHTQFSTLQEHQWNVKVGNPCMASLLMLNNVVLLLIKDK